MEADKQHLSQYNANGDQLAKEIAREKMMKVAKHRKEMEEQRRLEYIKQEIREKNEMEQEREDMKLLQTQIREAREAERNARARKRDINEKMMSSYKVLMEEKAMKEAVQRESARHDRMVAENNARSTRELETARKRKKRMDQSAYRRELAEQVQQKKAQKALKYHLSEQERIINRQFLQEVIDGQDSGPVVSMAQTGKEANTHLGPKLAAEVIHIDKLEIIPSTVCPKRN